MLCGGKYYIEFDEDAVDGISRRYALSEDFFTALPQDEIKSGSLEANAHLRPVGGIWHLHFEISGNVAVVCDRCLDLVSFPVETVNDTDIKFDEVLEADETETSIILPVGEKGIDLAWYFYEAVLLSLPVKHVHADGECNRNMQDLLDRYENGSVSSSGTDSIDPRWESLEKLKQND